MKRENVFSRTPLWEKLVGLLGLMLICGTIIFLLWSAPRTDEEALDFSFTVHEAMALGSRFLVLLDVRNTGDHTASELGLEARLSPQQGDTESVEMTIAYLAAGSTQRVGIYFDTDPRDGNLEFRALGYQKP